MAEEAAPVLAEQQPEQPDQVAEPAEVAEPVAEAAPAEEAPADEAVAAEGGSKRGREEDGVDGEEEPAKRHAGLEEQPNETHEQEAFADGAAAAAAVAAATATAERLVAQYGSGAAATGTAVANGGDNPGHSNAGAEGMYAGVPAGDNPGHFENPGHAGPPPVKEGLGTTSNEDGSISELIAVSKHLVGKLIGKAGTTIQQLQASTATNIQIDQNESAEHPDTKMVTLRGAPDNVAKAKESIKQLLEEALAPQEGETEEKIPCPAGIVGRIIGRGGETIRSLQQSSGSHIMVDQNFPEGQDRMVIIKGQRDSVERAAAMINELIAGEPGSASAIIAKHSIGINLTVSCPKSMVGRVIGKGGETIKGLQRKYHTSIQVGSQVEQQGDPMTITITGPKGTAEPCKQEILALINDPYPPGPGGPRGMGYPRGPPGYGPPYGGPGPYGGPPPPAYGAPYGAPYPPYGAPYPSPGGYGGYGAPYGVPAAPYSGGAGAYGGAGYGQGGYGGAAAGGYSQGYGASGSGYGGEGGSQGAASGGYGGAAAAAPAAASGSVWQPVQDDQGRTYYYNTQTGASQWEKPADMA